MGNSEQNNKKYTCPMHPEVVSSKPGGCSKCGMDLVKMDENGHSMSGCCGGHSKSTSEKPPRNFIGKFLHNYGKKLEEKDRKKATAGGCC